VIEQVGGWLLVVLAGLAIGATSIGGVIVVPALTTFMGLELPIALAVSSLAFLGTGLWSLSHSNRSNKQASIGNSYMMWAALAGAFMGALASAYIPTLWVRIWVGGLALASGFYSLWRMQHSTPSLADRDWPARKGQGWIGIFVGAGSALSGTGGPVILLPLLNLTGRPVERSILAAQAIQIPIAIAASMAHLSAGRFNWTTSTIVAGLLIVGAVMGRQIARRVPLHFLQTATATLLIATGLWFLLF
jgi:uncharacterized protein